MVPLDERSVQHTAMAAAFENISAVKTPIVAAVNGYALGGGCELAMLCDVIYASDKAIFGQPEIKLGTIPGIGGSQNLTRAVGKAKAMDLCLTGRNMDAAEAEAAGLVARVFPHDELMTEATKAAETIASYSKPVAAMCKEAVMAAQVNAGLGQGMVDERMLFWKTFATADRKEGMEAFVGKREPTWKDE